ncbi:aspartate dehydrogenase [Dinoroseobacter sp. S124A]|uniref:aspartate dehydrogenase n=1 Tax=Dinoroseobacter sp. S124A TaxID=3415128 RepID=UPI003C7AAA35
MRIAFIGLGAINRAVAAGLREGAQPATMAALTRQGATAPEVSALGTLDALRDFAPDLVVEAAGHAAARSYAPALLADGMSVLLASVGALADPETEDRFRAAPQKGAQLLIPAGALGGLDMVAALPKSTLHSVTYTGTKPPRAWAGSPAAEGHDLEALTRPRLLFEGTAREAALRFPKNANVAATLALAGLGFDETDARLIADPAATGNSHAYTVASEAAEMSFAVTAKPSATPGTSATTAFSLLRAIRNRDAALVI